MMNLRVALFCSYDVIAGGCTSPPATPLTLTTIFFVTPGSPAPTNHGSVSKFQVPCLEQPSTQSPSQTKSDANPPLNASNLTEVDMGGTQETVIEVIEVAEDITPPDAQAQPELRKRKNTDPGFLE
jgi:hypothetical protein